jgi:hypothetical protein
MFASAGAKTLAPLDALIAWVLASHCLSVILVLYGLRQSEVVRTGARALFDQGAGE